MAVDLYLNIDGIQGESEVERYKNQIKITSWTWAAAQISTVRGTGGSGAGKVDPKDVTVSAWLDKSTTQLYKAICEGRHIKSATLSAVKAQDNMALRPYLTATFSPVFITSIAIGASEEIPSVAISFAYNAVQFEYSTQAANGILTSTGPVGYDVSTNKTT